MLATPRFWNPPDSDLFTSTEPGPSHLLVMSKQLSPAALPRTCLECLKSSIRRVTLPGRKGNHVNVGRCCLWQAQDENHLGRGIHNAVFSETVHFHFNKQGAKVKGWIHKVSGTGQVTKSNFLEISLCLLCLLTNGNKRSLPSFLPAQ